MPVKLKFRTGLPATITYLVWGKTDEQAQDYQWFLAFYDRKNHRFVLHDMTLPIVDVKRWTVIGRADGTDV